MKAKFGKATYVGRPLIDAEIQPFNAVARAWDWQAASQMQRAAVSIRGNYLAFAHDVTIECPSSVNYVVLYGVHQVFSLMLEREFVPRDDRLLLIEKGTEVEICSSAST